MTITLDSPSIVGPGQNISPQGVYFVAEGTVPVTVQIDGYPDAIRGELVRIETIDQNKVGLAVRFDAPLELPPS